MVMADTRVWTREDLHALPDDGNRYELVDGMLLVTPSPRYIHQFAVGELNDRLRTYAHTNRLGQVLASPADLDLQSGQLVQPDIFVLPIEPDRRLREWEEAGIPSLIVEVLSPSTARYDRVIKRQLYQRTGVPTYWIVDLDARLVEVWTTDHPAPAVTDDILTWQPRDDVPPLRIDLPGLFAEIWGDRPAPPPTRP
jgi:Uma2 family endonuclease